MESLSYHLGLKEEFKEFDMVYEDIKSQLRKTRSTENIFASTETLKFNNNDFKKDLKSLKKTLFASAESLILKLDEDNLTPPKVKPKSPKRFPAKKVSDSKCIFSSFF